MTDKAFSNVDTPNYSLYTLYLGGCGQFTDQGILQICQLFPKMKELIIPWNKLLTDEALFHIANLLPLVRTLSLAYCNRITDQGLKSVLEKCRNLRKIDFAFCPEISMTGFLGSLAFAKQLQVARINKNSTSDPVFEIFQAEIRKLCPNLKIET